MIFALVVSGLLPNILYWIPERLKARLLPSRILRRFLFMIPYLIWILVLPPGAAFSTSLFLACVMIPVLVWLFALRKEIKFYLVPRFAAIRGPVHLRTFLEWFIVWLLSSVSEEVFFRHAILTAYPYYFAVLVQAILFTLSHWWTPWSESFSRQDFARQFSLGITFGIYFIATRDLLGVIAGHLIVNSPQMIGFFWRYWEGKVFSTEELWT